MPRNDDEQHSKTYRSNPLPPVPTGPGLVGCGVWGVIGVLLFLLFKNYMDHRTPTEPTIVAACAPQVQPQNGTVGILDPSVMRRSDVLFSAVEITNNFTKPIAAYLMSPAGDGKRYAVAHVGPGTSVMLSAPVGVYGVKLEHGSRWCGDDKGYGDGVKFTLTTNFQNEAGKTGKILIGRTDATSPSVSFAHTAPEPPPPVFAVSGNGSLDLRQDANGHYAVDGTILGAPVQFLLDTGATTTAVTNDFALRARIPSCRPTTTNTANGVTNACLARVPELSFGNFRVTDVDVVILPHLTGSEALLGMNVLRHFGIEQRSGMMRISAP